MISDKIITSVNIRLHMDYLENKDWFVVRAVVNNGFVLTKVSCFIT